jgi:nucleotide-binding universal stress UspA family protein
VKDVTTMTDSPFHETIVVGVDTSAASAAALCWAAAEAEHRRARLHAVHVVEHTQRASTSPDRDLDLDLRAARLTMPGRVGDWLYRSGVDVDVAVSILTGDVAGQLARTASDASLVVIGAPASSHHRALPTDLAADCLCPVVVVDEEDEATYVDQSQHQSPSSGTARDCTPSSTGPV